MYVPDRVCGILNKIVHGDRLTHWFFVDTAENGQLAKEKHAFAKSPITNCNIQLQYPTVTKEASFMYRNTTGSTRNPMLLLLFVCIGVVAGAFIGETLGNLPYLNWLRYGKEFGITSPFVLDIDIIRFQLAFSLRINVASVLGVVGAMIAFKKMV